MYIDVETGEVINTEKVKAKWHSSSERIGWGDKSFQYTIKGERWRINYTLSIPETIEKNRETYFTLNVYDSENKLLKLITGDKAYTDIVDIEGSAGTYYFEIIAGAIEWRVKIEQYY